MSMIVQCAALVAAGAVVHLLVYLLLSCLLRAKAATKRAHDLKIWRCYFELVRSGEKPFEVRYAMDRDFRVGDTLVLREYESPFGYSGRVCRKRITYVLRGGAFGIDRDVVVLGLRRVWWWQR